MAKTRDFASEITARRGRLFKRKHEKTQVSERLNALATTFEAVRPLQKAARDELLRYFPVGLVAALEFYFRDEVREAIRQFQVDDAVIQKLVEQPISLDTALDIERGKITVAEYVAHRVPLNNLADISQIMSKVCGEDYLSWIKTASKDGKPVLQGQHIAVLNRLFETRHIICHELATKHQVKTDEVMGYFDGVRRLLAASEIKVYGEDYTAKAP
jgi:hypothetical protein